MVHYHTPNAVEFYRYGRGQLAKLSIGSHDTRPLHKILTDFYTRQGTLPRDGDSVQYQRVQSRSFATWTPRGWFYGTQPKGSQALSALIDQSIEERLVTIEAHHRQYIGLEII